MFHRLTLAILIAAAALSHGGEFISDIHRFTVRTPDTESWIRGPVQQLGRDAEMVYSVRNMEGREGFAMTIIPKIPTNDVMNPAAVSRISELVGIQGFTVAAQSERVVDGVRYLELLGRRVDENGGKVAAVVRATIRDNTVYVATFYGQGGDERAQDPRFLRVLDTLRFFENARVAPSPLMDPMHGYYRSAYLACLAGAGVLSLWFGYVLIRYRRRLQ